MFNECPYIWYRLNFTTDFLSQNNLKAKYQGKNGQIYRGYMPARGYEFYLRVWTRYLTSERSERVRYRIEHEKIKFISISGHVIFCSLYKHTYDDVIDYFPKISDHFPEISEDFPKFVRRPDERFRTFSEHFPKITEDHRRLPKTTEEEPIMFRSCSKTSGYFVRDYAAKAMVIMLSSRVKICYLHVEDMKFSRESSLGISLVFI